MTEEQKERSRQYQREYYQSHRQEHIEKTTEWKKNHPEKVKEYAKKYFKKYYANNKDRIMQRRRELHPRKMVEVVRCKDCKHYHPGFTCELLQKPADKTNNWFCDDGERA